MKPEFRIGIDTTLTVTTLWSIDHGRRRIVVGHEPIKRGTLPKMNGLQWQAIVEILGPDRQDHRSTFYRVGPRGAYRRIYGIRPESA